MSDSPFPYGGNITNMADLQTAIERDPRGAAIVIRDLQQELDLSVELRQSVERVAQAEIAELRRAMIEEA